MGLGYVPLHFYSAALLFGVAFTVMPSVNAIVSDVASPQQQGTAQGAMHGIKALIEGVGPLFFAILFNIFRGAHVGGLNAPSGTSTSMVVPIFFFKKKIHHVSYRIRVGFLFLFLFLFLFCFFSFFLPHRSSYTTAQKMC